MKSFSPSVLRAGISAVALLSAMPAFAQSAPAEEEGYSEGEIIVSARRREENLQDVPLVVNAIGKETVEKLNLQDAKEIQALVPGLLMTSQGYAASGQIRGLQFDTNASSLASVAFYLNDAPANPRAVMSQLYDIGQIEVLRGPQGTLRGAAAPSGSITFTTRKPNLDEVGATFSGTLTDTHGRNVNAAINIPIIKDVLGVRFAGVYDRNRGNRVTSIATNRAPGELYAEEIGGRASVLFVPTDWLRLEGVYQAIDFKSRQYEAYASYSLANPAGAASPVLIRPEDRLSIQETPSTQRQKFEIYNWRAEVRFAGQKLIYQGAHTDYNSDGLGNQDSANFLQNRDIFQRTLLSAPQDSHEIRLQNEERVAGIFDYVLGYYSTSQISNIALTVQTPVLFPNLSFLGPLAGSIAAVADTNIDSLVGGPAREKSFYGNLTAHIGDKLQVSGGLRRVKYTEFPSSLRIGANTIPSNPGVDDRKWIYSASIQYNFTPDIMVYANTGTSRRRGPSIFQSALLQSARQRSFVFLPSEDSKSYELGFKTSWLDNRLTLNVTAYRQTFKNYPYKLSNGVYYIDYDFLNGGFVPKVGNSFQWGAGVPVEITGVEAELGWRVSPRFNVNVVASYSDGKIKNGAIPCNDLNGDRKPDTLAGAPTVAQLQAAYGANQIGICDVTQRSSQQPPFSATVQAEYNTPVTDKVEVFARGLLSYFGASKNDPTLTFDDVGAFGLLNLYGGVRDSEGAWEVNFYGKNIFNTIRYSRFGPPASTSYQELTLASGFRATQGMAFTSPYSQITTNAAREFGVNVRFALGSR